MDWEKGMGRVSWQECIDIMGIGDAFHEDDCIRNGSGGVSLR